MKIYNLIHELDTSDEWSCNVKPFLAKLSAQKTMREDWQETARNWEYDSKEHGDDDECECGEETAVIRDGENFVHWRIEEHDLGVQVAIRVKGGLVTDIFANADLEADVYDLDVSDFPDAGEEAEADKRKSKIEKLSKTPGWRAIW